MAGFQIGSVKAIPDRVVIAGAESELKSVTEVTTEPIDLSGVNEGFSLIVPLEHHGTYTYFKDVKTTEVQIEIQPVEQPPQEKMEPMKTPKKEQLKKKGNS